MLEGFHPAVRAWFERRFPAWPTEPQEQGWAEIAAGRHTLIAAPTGSGKTLAAFLWALDRLAQEPRPEDPGQRCRVLYVSPLKALAVDVERNLRTPLTVIRQAAVRLGLPEPEIDVAIRSGDTSADARRRFTTKPPDILITTPESLFLILTSRARGSLRGVQTVIVDEVHAVVGTKRGAHLALSLERLQALVAAGAPGVRPQRIGCSATVSPVTDALAFLTGATAHDPVAIDAGFARRLDVQVTAPVDDFLTASSDTIWDAPSSSQSGNTAIVKWRTKASWDGGRLVLYTWNTALNQMRDIMSINGAQLTIVRATEQPGPSTNATLTYSR